MKDTLKRDLGENVNVTCKATGNPAPSVKWIVKTDDERHAPVRQSDGKNHTLRINSIQEQHYGVYVCVAENRFGNDTFSFALGKCWVLILSFFLSVGAFKNRHPRRGA